MPAKDWTGQKFGILTAIEPVRQNKQRSWLWRFDCDCGGSVIVAPKNVKSGGTSGCLECKSERVKGKYRKDWAGQKFGSLTAIRHHDMAGEKGKESSRWLFSCDCGGSHIAKPHFVEKGMISGCIDCYADRVREYKTNAPKTHGMSKTPIYAAWNMMKARCNNPQNHKYPYYGARGIKVCEEWQSFENFYSDMGDRPEGLTVGRIDNDGDYEPSNCRWETHLQQAHNKRPNGTALLGGY